MFNFAEDTGSFWLLLVDDIFVGRGEHINRSGVLRDKIFR